MAKKNKPYWQDRQEKKYLAGEKKVNDYYRSLEKSFEQSKREIESVINDFYMRYAKENKLSFAEAQLRLSKAEIGALQDFIDLAKANMGKYNLELNNMSIRARITRYEALQKQIDAQLQQLYAIEYQHKGEELLKEIYSDTYYKTWFNIDQYHGFHQEFAQISGKTIEELIKYPFNGADFSTRLWKQKDHMFQKLNESITTMLIQGKNPQTLAGQFAKAFGTKEYEAYRLLHTEGSFIMGQGTLAGYIEDGVTKYRILATLDIKTSDKCRGMDGKEFNVEDAVVGVNYWPFHPHCRTTDVPVYEDDGLSEETRVARDPVTGKAYKVPADMTYEQWHKRHIEGNPEASLAIKKAKNLEPDKTQFEKYKAIFKKEIPNSLDDFQNLKYNDVEKWNSLKKQKQEKLSQMEFPDMNKLIKKLGNKEARLWYKANDEKIPTLIDTAKTLKEQAMQACELRNAFRANTRDLMRDQTKRKLLDERYPNKPFEDLVKHKKLKYGLSDEQVYFDIIRSSQTTNKAFDILAGLEE